jgi:toxin secretion/phage lysis holin
MENIQDLVKNTLGNTLIIALFTIIIIDIITGLLKALLQKNINSSIGLSGMVKHTAIMLMVMIGYPLLSIFELNVFKEAIIGFFILQYLISIIENTNSLGISYPKWITTYITKVYEKADTNEDKEIE